ncbi:MAG: hypothetical protein ABSE82_01200 [Nitrososphaerales archaeon]
MSLDQVSPESSEVVFDLLTWIQDNIPESVLRDYPTLSLFDYLRVFDAAKATLSLPDRLAHQYSKSALGIAYSKLQLSEQR